MKTDADSSRIHQWERWNEIVLSWIMNTVSKLFAGIAYSTSAHTLRRDLKNRYDKISGSRIFAIHREINSQVQGSRIIQFVPPD